MAEISSKFGASYRPSRQIRNMPFFANTFEPFYHILFYIFANYVIPKKSENNEVQWSDFYFWGFIFHGDTLDF